MEVLNGHYSQDTAYLVEDYPYGFRLRCKIRYWLENHPKHGCRLWSQTSNPKRDGLTWNKPKASTYSSIGGSMYLNEDNHVCWTGLSYYSSAAEAQTWYNTYGAGIEPGYPRQVVEEYIEKKVKYEAARASGLSMHDAAVKTIKEDIENGNHNGA